MPQYQRLMGECGRPENPQPVVATPDRWKPGTSAEFVASCPLQLHSEITLSGMSVERTAHRKGSEWTPGDSLQRHLSRFSQMGGGGLFRCHLRGDGDDASSRGSA